MSGRISKPAGTYFLQKRAGLGSLGEELRNNNGDVREQKKSARCHWGKKSTNRDMLRGRQGARFAFRVLRKDRGLAICAMKKRSGKALCP